MSNGSSGVNGSGRLPQASEPPSAVAELAASCVRYVATRYKVELDFAPETLPLVDQYVRDARSDAKERPQALPLLAASVGAYLGEVMRRSFGAFWRAEGEHASWRLCFQKVYLTCNPLGMAVEGLTLQDADDWHAHFEVDEADADAVAGRLAAIPPVDEADFFLPSTRFEALTLLHEALRAKMEATNTADVTFGPADYD